jgi:hypothetical protein
VKQFGCLEDVWDGSKRLNGGNNAEGILLYRRVVQFDETRFLAAKTCEIEFGIGTMHCKGKFGQL